jgi:hypothetical protein
VVAVGVAVADGVVVAVMVAVVVGVGVVVMVAVVVGVVLSMRAMIDAALECSTKQTEK